MAACELGEAHDGDGAARLRERMSVRRGRERVSPSGSGAVGTRPSCPRAGPTSPAIADVRPPHGGRGLARSATNAALFVAIRAQHAHLIAQLCDHVTPNPW